MAQDGQSDVSTAGKVAYQPLSPLKGQIRLLQILPPLPNGRVSCALSTVSLSDKPAFICLSYVWGDASVTEEVIVDGNPMQVTKKSCCRSEECQAPLGKYLLRLRCY